MPEPSVRVCPRCGEPAGHQRFCGSCGLNIWELHELPTRADFEARVGEMPKEPGASEPPPRSSSWRDLMRQAGDLAAPYVDSAADVLSGRRVPQTSPRTQRESPTSSASASARPNTSWASSRSPTSRTQEDETPPLREDETPPPPRSATSRSTDSEERDDARPPLTARLGRGIGSTAGYATRSYVGIATEPVVDTVWTNRPNLPTWQKVIGTIAWPIIVLTPHGWLFLGASFFVMVILGDRSPYQWATWVTKWASVFLLVTATIAAIAAIILLAAK